MKYSFEDLAKEDRASFFACFQAVLEEGFSQYSPRQRKNKLRRWQKKLPAWRSREDKKILLAKKKEEVVGFLIASQEKGGVSYLNWLGVKREFQKQGIGRRLLKEWEVWAKKRGCHKLRTQTSNRENLSFYQKSGFVQEGLKKNDRYHLDFYVLGKFL